MNKTMLKRHLLMTLCVVVFLCIGILVYNGVRSSAVKAQEKFELVQNSYEINTEEVLEEYMSNTNSRRSPFVTITGPMMAAQPVKINFRDITSAEQFLYWEGEIERYKMVMVPVTKYKTTTVNGKSKTTSYTVMEPRWRWRTDDSRAGSTKTIKVLGQEFSSLKKVSSFSKSSKLEGMGLNVPVNKNSSYYKPSTNTRYSFRVVKEGKVVTMLGKIVDGQFVDDDRLDANMITGTRAEMIKKYDKSGFLMNLAPILMCIFWTAGLVGTYYVLKVYDETYKIMRYRFIDDIMGKSKGYIVSSPYDIPVGRWPAPIVEEDTGVL